MFCLSAGNARGALRVEVYWKPAPDGNFSVWSGIFGEPFHSIDSPGQKVRIHRVYGDVDRHVRLINTESSLGQLLQITEVTRVGLILLRECSQLVDMIRFKKAMQRLANLLKVWLCAYLDFSHHACPSVGPA